MASLSNQTTFAIINVVSDIINEKGILSQDGTDKAKAPSVPQNSASMPPKDKHAELTGTPFFEHDAGIPECIFDYILNEFEEGMMKPVNVRFDHPATGRKSRRRKVDCRNRLLLWLNQMKTRKLIWDASFEYGWNNKSVSDDFRHLSYEFVECFDEQWLKEMSANEQLQSQGVYAEFPTAVGSIDGIQRIRRRSVHLPENVQRKEMYCWKHRNAEGQNVQAFVDSFGLAREVLISMISGRRAFPVTVCHTFNCCRCPWRISGQSCVQTFVRGSFAGDHFGRRWLSGQRRQNDHLSRQRGPAVLVAQTPSLVGGEVLWEAESVADDRR